MPIVSDGILSCFGHNCFSGIAATAVLQTTTASLMDKDRRERSGIAFAFGAYVFPPSCWLCLKRTQWAGKGGQRQSEEQTLSAPCRAHLTKDGPYSAWHGNYVCIFIFPVPLVHQQTHCDSSFPPGRNKASRLGQMLAREAAHSPYFLDSKRQMPGWACCPCSITRIAVLHSDLLRRQL